MAEMEYGQQALAAMQAADAARAAEARMNDEGESVATPAEFAKGGDLAADAEDEEDEEEEMLKGAALKARAEELGIPSGMSADETRAAIADAEGSGDELHGDAPADPDADPEE